MLWFVTWTSCVKFFCFRLSLYLPSSLSKFGNTWLSWWEWQWNQRCCCTWCTVGELGACSWCWGDHWSKSRTFTSRSFLRGNYNTLIFVPEGHWDLLNSYWAFNMKVNSVSEDILVSTPKIKTDIDMILWLLHLKWDVIGCNPIYISFRDLCLKPKVWAKI